MRKLLLLLLVVALLMVALPTQAQANGRRGAAGVVATPNVFVGHAGFIGHNAFFNTRVLFVPTNASFFTPAFVPGYLPAANYSRFNAAFDPGYFAPSFNSYSSFSSYATGGGGCGVGGAVGGAGGPLVVGGRVVWP